MTIAVITGDLIGSTSGAQTAAFMQRLDALLAQAETRFTCSAQSFRGDAFQLSLPDPRAGAACALFLRAGLIGASPSRKERWDARLCVAFGAGPGQGESWGEAHVQSGHGLDGIGKARLALWASSKLFCLAGGLATAFADELINGWTPSEAETWFVHRQHPESHRAVAEQLGKRRATVTQTLLRARYTLLDRYIDELNELLEHCGVI